jgi:hypothetical protein
MTATSVVYRLLTREPLVGVASAFALAFVRSAAPSWTRSRKTRQALCWRWWHAPCTMPTLVKKSAKLGPVVMEEEEKETIMP